MSQLQRVPLLLITQCPDALMWYRHRVGQLVPHVGWTADSGYMSREPAGFVNFVRNADARPIEIYVKPAELASWPFNSRANPFIPNERETRTRPCAGQSRTQSLVEAVVNITIGWLLSLGVTAVVLPAFGHMVTLSENVAMTSIFTVISLIRSYALRRLFNHLHRKHT